METKFTPGPWYAEKMKVFSHVAGRTKVADVVDFSVTGLSADMKSESDGNAKLIAAAPDMFRALAVIANGIKETVPAARTFLDDEILQLAEATIAKATS